MKLFSELFKKSIPVYIELRGRELLLAEGYCRIEEYSLEKITLASDINRISVYGDSLELCHLSAERMAIDGRIDRIEFL